MIEETSKVERTAMVMGDLDGEKRTKLILSNNIASSSNTNLKQLESFFCQFWPELCENSVICDINQNCLQSVEQLQPPDEEPDLQSNSIASSSLMLIEPEQRMETCRSKLILTPLKSPGLVLSLMRRGFDKDACDGGNCDDDVYMDMSSISRKKRIKKSSLTRRRYSRLSSNSKTRLVRKISNYDQKFYKIEPGVSHCQNHLCQLQVTVNGKHVCGDLILKNL